MNTPSHTPLRPRALPALLLFAAIFAVLEGAGLNAFAQFPAGDLTVTVEELEGGEVRFSLAGSAPLREEGGFGNTGFDNLSPSPPHTLTSYSSAPLPSGLTLSAGGNDNPITYIYFDPSSFWYMGSFWSGTLPQNTNVSGSGTGISSTIPFSNFIPGTYIVAGHAFDVTYRVVARAAPAPRLLLNGPGRFPATVVGRSSRPEVMRIANVGNAAASGVTMEVSGRAARDFKSTPPPATIPAGGSAIVKITFKPRAKGARKAEAVVASANASTVRAGLKGKGKGK